MNIKGLTYPISPIDTEISVKPTGRSVKSEGSSPDRDPNGQRQREDFQNTKEFLNDEEMEKALTTLRSLPGVKENNLKVELVVKEVFRYVLITDPQGKTIRRIPERELWPLIQEKEGGRGHLLDRTG